MNLEINYKKLKIDFLYADKFYVFQIKNFLNKQTYEFINNNFPSLDKKLFRESFLKYSIASNSENYKELLLQNKNLKKINDLLKETTLPRFFFKKLYFKIIKSNLNNYSSLKKLFKIPNFSESKTIFSHNYETRIQYSILTNKAVINPHTDGKAKVLSLMLYFPDDKSKLSLAEQEKFGTDFYLSDQENYINNHINNIDEIKKFKNENKIICKTKFEKYHLYGFIRNAYSWHSVDEIQAENYLRRSININIFMN
jgi:hypothetical protein